MISLKSTLELIEFNERNFQLQYDLPFVEVYRARQFTFRALPTMHLQSASEVDVARRGSQLSVWNCDGEVIDSTNVKIRRANRRYKLH